MRIVDCFNTINSKIEFFKQNLAPKLYLYMQEEQQQLEDRQVFSVPEPTSILIQYPEDVPQKEDQLPRESPSKLIYEEQQSNSALNPQYLQKLMKQAENWNFQEIQKQMPKVRPVRQPRKPMRAYDIFLEKQSALKKKDEFLSLQMKAQQKELAKKIWNEMPTKEKSKYYEQENIMLEKYNKIYAEYEILEKNKKIPSAYTRFSRLKFFELQAKSHMEMQIIDINREIGRQWRNLDPQEKERYQEEYEIQKNEEEERQLEMNTPEARENYKKKLKQYYIDMNVYKQKIRIDCGIMADNLDDHLKLIAKQNIVKQKNRERKQNQKKKQIQKYEKEMNRRLKENLEKIEKLRKEELERFRLGIQDEIDEQKKLRTPKKNLIARRKEVTAEKTKTSKKSNKAPITEDNDKKVEVKPFEVEGMQQQESSSISLEITGKPV